MTFKEARLPLHPLRVLSLYCLRLRPGREVGAIGRSSGDVRAGTEDSQSRMRSLSKCLGPQGSWTAGGASHGQVPCGAPKCGLPPYVGSTSSPSSLCQTQMRPSSPSSEMLLLPVIADLRKWIQEAMQAIP